MGSPVRRLGAGVHARRVAAALALALAAACSRGEGEPQAAPPAADSALRAVGSAACGRCHPREVAAWRGSQHDLAMQPARAETVLGDFRGASFTQFGVTTTFRRRDRAFVVRSEGPDGALHDYEIAYTFGVHPLQQYLVPFPDGRYQALSIAWDARPARAGGQRWFSLQPAERIRPGDPLHWTGLAYGWNARCAACHSTNLEKGYAAAEDRYDTRWSEPSVGCEACHGPGSVHVAWAEHSAHAASGGDPRRGLVVDLASDGATWALAPGEVIARRSAPRGAPVEIETCARCHSRRAEIAPHDEPGHPLLDAYRPALLDEGLYFPDGQIEDEVYVYGSFLQSRMYAAGVSCGDCHEPHGLRLRAEGNALCGRCHDPAHFDSPSHHFHAAGSDAARCVACHMPARTYMEIDPRHDHGLRVPRPDLSAALGTPDVCTGCHRDRSDAWAAASVVRRYGPERAGGQRFAEALAAGRREALDAHARLAALVGAASQPAIARATALRLLAQQPPVAGALVRAGLADGDALVRMAALEAAEALTQGERLSLARASLRDPVRAVRIQAAQALASVAPELWQEESRADFSAAVAELRAAHRANEDQPEGRLGLAVLAAEFGDLGEARRQCEAALRLAPWFVPAAVNLADTHRAEGRDDEGEVVLEDALARTPDAAALHHALGLLRARQKRLPEALASLRRATELEPGNVRYAYVYGVALESAGQGERALAVLGAAQQKWPGDRDLLIALVALHRDRGDPSGAIRYAQMLIQRDPGDTEARELVGQLAPGAAR